jgi:hypothetical protein
VRVVLDDNFAPFSAGFEQAGAALYRTGVSADRTSNQFIIILPGG